MQFVIPEGAQVHITIGAPPPMLALPNPAAASPPVAAAKRPVLTGAVALCLVAGAFMAGRSQSAHQAAATATRAVAEATTPPETSVAPIMPQAPPAVAGMPADFRDQLARPPQITPPPGQAPQPAGAPAATNPFGLQG